MRELATLDPARFSPREHAALVWVRSFLTCPDGVPADVEEEFRVRVSPDEQLLVAASMKGMFCVNLSLNTGIHVLSRVTGRPVATSCAL